MNSLSRYFFPLVVLLLWQAAGMSGMLPYRTIPSPFEILAALIELATRGLPAGNPLALHCLYSLLRVGCGFVLAVCVGLPLGIVLGWSKVLRRIISPVLEMLRPIPPLAWIPLAILWFGIGLMSASFIIFLGCFFPILLSTTAGVVAVEPLLVDAARTLGADKRTIFMKVYLPGATPSIFTGLRIGLGIGWMTLVAAEFTGVKSGFGLGYMIMTARDIQRPDLVIAGMAVIGITGLALDGVIRLWEKRALRWRRNSK
jgi:ABC-type nitrate/sulfonate/bicarbonate transport system permease component